VTVFILQQFMCFCHARVQSIHTHERTHTHMHIYTRAEQCNFPLLKYTSLRLTGFYRACGEQWHTASPRALVLMLLGVAQLACTAPDRCAHVCVCVCVFVCVCWVCVIVHKCVCELVHLYMPLRMCICMHMCGICCWWYVMRVLHLYFAGV
jgi:hypothetical protein